MKQRITSINRKKINYALLLIFLLALYILVSAFSYVNAVSCDLADSVFRLHVLANSDSTEDQNLKYKVRDAVLAYMNDICKDATSKEQAMEIAKEHSDEFKQIALDTVHQNGYEYDVTIEIGNYSFPTKEYGDITLPSGFYDALRIKIGKAEGRNWWCVMFPPLCFVDVSSGIVPEESKSQMKENLSEEEYSLISDQETSQISFKFKLIELFENVKMLTAKK